MNKVYKGDNGQLLISQNKITIKRKGVTAFLSHGLKGDKDIYIKNISAIEFKNAGMLIRGFIQFSLTGANESKKGIREASRDENSITFTKQQEKDFLEAKDLIESFIFKPELTEK